MEEDAPHVENRDRDRKNVRVSECERDPCLNTLGAYDPLAFSGREGDSASARPFVSVFLGADSATRIPAAGWGSSRERLSGWHRGSTVCHCNRRQPDRQEG